MELRKNADSGTLLNYDKNDFSRGYNEVKEAFRALTHDNILQFYISEADFRPSNVGDDGNDIGYNIHSFDIRDQKIFENAQPVEVEFKFFKNIPAGIYGYALILTNKYNFRKQ